MVNTQYILQLTIVTLNKNVQFFIQEDTKEYKNLFTSDGLCPTLKDLEQIFDNSDDAASGDETVRLVSVHPSYIILVCSVCCCSKTNRKVVCYLMIKLHCLLDL